MSDVKTGLIAIGLGLVAIASPACGGGTAQPAATSDRLCSGARIVFFPGGNQASAFAVSVYNGARQAEHDLGPQVDYRWSDWDPNKMTTQFKDALATHPDGIAVMGHPGDQAFDPLIEQAESQGVIVTSQNTTLPAAEAKYRDGGFGYVGQEVYNSGYSLGRESVRRFGLRAGDRAMVWGLLSEPTRGLRTKGVLDALKESGVNADYMEIDSATNADAAAGTPIVAAYIAAHPDVRLIVTDHGGLTAQAESYMKAAGKKPGEIPVAGFDLSAATVTAIEGGWTGLVLDQQPWLQGYLPILQICLTKLYRFAGLHVDTGSGFVDKSNVRLIAPYVARGIR